LTVSGALNATLATVAQPNVTSLGTLTGLTLGGNLLFTTDNTRDIGASGANRPRDLFLGRNLLAGGSGQFATLGVNAAPPGSGSVVYVNGGLGVGDYVPVTSPVTMFHVKGNVYQTNGVWAIGGATAGPLAYVALNFQPNLVGVANPTGFIMRPVYDTAATSIITNFASQVAVPASLSTGTVTSMQASSISMGSSAAVGTSRGLWVNNQGGTGVANAYGVYIDSQSGASSTNVGLYNAGTSQFGNYLDVLEQATPGTPAAGYLRVYAKVDHYLYTKDSTGVERAFVDKALRTYVQRVMSTIDPGGPPAPPP
jgi:hypothetical protein